MKKRAPGLVRSGYIGDEILPNYIRDYFVSHYKDPYKPNRIMESDKFFFFFVAQFVGDVKGLIGFFGEIGHVYPIASGLLLPLLSKSHR